MARGVAESRSISYAQSVALFSAASRLGEKKITQTIESSQYTSAPIPGLPKKILGRLLLVSSLSRRLAMSQAIGLEAKKHGQEQAIPV